MPKVHTPGCHATGSNQLVQLAAEAVTVSGERLAQLLRQLLDASVVDALSRNLTESDLERGCPIATVAMAAPA